MLVDATFVAFGGAGLWDIRVNQRKIKSCPFAGLGGKIQRHVTADIRNGDLLKHHLHSSNPDFVFHLAAQPW